MRKDDYSSYYSKLSWPAEWKDDHSDSAERFVPVELSPYLNNISFADKVTSANGNLNIWRPRNGELEAIRFNSLNFPRHCEKYIEPAIWRQRIPVARETPILALGLPNNIAAHIFSITCLRSEEY